MLSSNWRDKQLEAFILEFNPDIIFAPLYANNFLLSLNRYVFNLLKKPVISYVSDDVYTLKQLHFSPVYWINRFVQRHSMQKLASRYAFIYTMTDEQAEQMENDLGLDMRILRKCLSVGQTNTNKKQDSCIRFIYAGGLYLGRDKTLLHLANALRSLTSGSVRLDVFTNTKLTKRVKQTLSDHITTFLHAGIPYNELMQQYYISDVAIHVESFSSKNARTCQLSFSTKIIDCLFSGCAVLAICPPSNAGLRYLKREDAAICVEKQDEIGKAVRRICEQPELLEVYAKKALNCAQRNHDLGVMQAMIRNDFETSIDSYN